MKTNQRATIVLTIMFTLLLSACASTPSNLATDQVSPLSGVSPISTATPAPRKEATVHIPQVTPMPSKAAIVGQVVSISTAEPQPLPQTIVRLARVFWNEQKTEGAFVIEAGSSPSTVTNDDGTFFFSNVEPADYVIVVGELQGDHVIIAETDGKAKIFTAEQGKTLDVGKLQVELGR
jgi:hypothetical protein